ncbi:N-alpha-acetyltransferase 30 [Alosa pseudoharengus]|uniref:N-alpha-acetyltransferase 30 n=1 Tax=Alosa pseudoharengus TaxID=34774 RepID=UPI003F8B35CB
MAAVPTGPSSALPESPAEITPFPGDGCGVPGEGKRQELVTPAKVLEQQVSEGKIVKNTNQKCSLSHSESTQHNHNRTEEQQVNGVNPSMEDGFSHNHVDESPDELRQSPDRSDSCVDAVSRTASDRNCFCERQERGPCANCCQTQSNNSDGLETRTEPNSEACQSPCGSAVGDQNTETNSDGTEAHRHSGENLDKGANAAEPNPVEDSTPAAQLARLDLNSEAGFDQEIRYVRYESELQMPGIMRLITKDLSEPYSIYTYRYFIHNWPQLCFLAVVDGECVGAIVCKLDMHKKMFRRGYIAMLAVDSKHRRKSIGTNLVKKAIYAMVEGDCDEVVLETEITNKSALKLYENLGFVRDKRLFRYYLNGVDALRLKLWLR